MPVSVAFVGVLVLLNALATFAVGAMWLWAAGDADVLGDVDTTADDAQAYGWTAVALGVIILLVGIGLFRGSRFSRFLVMALMVLRIGLDVFAIVQIDGYSLPQGLVSIAWSLLILILLTTAPASRYFHQR
ncbi:DUF7144 family membrane protein [Demequina aestuarii]|uniref:DUF7144 family membrane protein n=1 Tax=Demequina aestuarii TaxID=327095 RepID=UPI00128E17E3|nr:hypothetical protein [Demequina aestuarii]